LSNLECYDKALIELEKVVNADAGHAEALNSIGFIYFKLENNKKAKGYLQRAIEIRPDYAQALDNLNLLEK